MTRETTHRTRRLAARAPLSRGGGGSQDTATTRNIENGNRATNTFRRRYHRDTAPSPSPQRVRLIDRMTYEDGSQVDPVVGAIRDNITRDRGNIRARADTSGCDTQGTSLVCTQNVETQSAMQVVETKTTTTVTETVKTKVTTQGNRLSSSFFFLSVLTELPQGQPQVPAAAPATTSQTTQPKPKASIEPIKMVNRPKGFRPYRGNTYRGDDAIKRAVQNPKLRAILAGKPLPRPRKDHDQPLLVTNNKNMGGII